jgi:hypothetical protein
MNKELFKIFIFISIVCVLFASCRVEEPLPPPQSSDTAFIQRNYYNALLEPVSQVLHGAGQSEYAFTKYFHALGEGRRPVIYKTYVDLNGNLYDFFLYLKEYLHFYASTNNVYLIPEIGLKMTIDGNPPNPYEDDVAAGLYDDEIQEFCRELELLGHPVFMRIGYEFNGVWNGYLPESYKKAYIRITDALRAHNLEAATVWCASHPLHNGTYNYMEYYPGDAYVDWWGIDLMFANDLTDAANKYFLADADLHGKPVMIAESTPANIGVTDGQNDWIAWFEPYFALIQSNPGIKAFSYINWNWADFPPLSTWGDARLEMNAQVLSNYIYKITSPLYFHGAPESNLRQNALGINDTTPPSRVNVSGVFNDHKVDLFWGQAHDDTQVVRYEIQTSGLSPISTIKTMFSDTYLAAGENKSYTVVAIDSGGNRGPPSFPVVVSIPDPLNKITNREFDDGTTAWEIAVWNGGSVNFNIDSTSNLSGTNSGKLMVVVGTGTAWQVQFRQRFYTHFGKEYQLIFSALADATAEITVMLQQSHDPYGSILQRNVILTTSPQVFSFSNQSDSSQDILFVTFMLGQADGRTIWLDKILLLESD